jgi:hypothetical protein
MLFPWLVICTPLVLRCMEHSGVLIAMNRNRYKY